MSRYIDHIFYINLDRREDRRAEIEKELNAFELTYERFPAIPHEMGIAGCTMSHMAVLKLAKQREYKNILIFEDDFMFSVSKPEFEHGLNEFFDKEIPYDVLMLAYNINEGALTNAPNHDFIKRIVHASTASCYIINHHYYDAIINLYEWAIPRLIETKQHWIYANDRVWRDLQARDTWYAMSRKFGRQRPSWSDNAQCWMDYDT